MDALFGAPELLILIFQSCDGVDDALSLASTCQLLASIWRTHTTAILYRLIEAQTPGFNQALIAVRATQPVHDAFHTFTLPPPPPPLHTLSAHARKPSLPELQQVLSLRHLARCVWYMYRRGTHADQMHLSEEAPWVSDDERARMGERFQRAVYRVLVAGAVLTRGYLEPLFKAAGGEGPRGLVGRLAGLGVDTEWRTEEVGRGDAEFLEGFGVYDLEGGREKWRGAFGELAGWLMGDIETSFVRVKSSNDQGREMGAEQLGRLQEVTFFLAAYEHVMDKLFSRFLPLPGDDENPDVPLPPPLQGPVRRVPVAMFGLFRPEVVWMPDRVEDATSVYLVNKPLVAEQPALATGEGPDGAGPSPWAVDVAWMLDVLHQQSGRPYHRNGRPSPPPALRFIEFVLAEFFQVRFDCQYLFDFASKYSFEDYTLGFLGDLELFGDRSIGCGTWLFEEDKAPPALSYRFLAG